MCILINKLHGIVKQILQTYYRAIKMKPADVKSIIYVKFSKENNYKDSIFKVADCVGISKYKNIFAKVYVLNWFEDFLSLKKLKNTVSWAH